MWLLLVFPSHDAQADSVALESIPNEGQEVAPDAGMVLLCPVVHRVHLIVINQ